MTESSSASSSNPRFASPEAYLAEVDKFVQSVQTAGESRPADAQTLQALLTQAKLYLHAGQSQVAATAYERLLVIMSHFEGAMPPAAAAPVEPAAASVQIGAATPEAAPATEVAAADEDDVTAPIVEILRAPEPAPAPAVPATGPFAPPPAGLPQAASPAYNQSDATLPRRRIVHVERKRIRPYRSPDADTSQPPVVDEIQRPPASPGFRLSTSIPANSQQSSRSQLLPLLLVVVLLAAALWVFLNGNSLLAVAGLGGTKPPTARVAVSQPAPSATPALAGRTPASSQLPTPAAPTSTMAGATPTASSTPTVVPTSTPSPTVTNTPSPTETPTETATPTATATDTPSPTPAMVFTGPDPLAGATQILFEENFNPKTYYWLLGETTFGRSRINNGALEITTKTTHSIAWLFGGMPQGQNFFEMATVTSGACDKDDHFGLVLRAETDSNLLLFGVTCDGRYRLQQNQGVIHRLLVLPTASDAIQTGLGAINELGARAEGKQISLYVNRQFLTRVETTDLSRGSFGAYVNATTTANLTASFSNFRAWVVGP